MSIRGLKRIALFTTVLVALQSQCLQATDVITGNVIVTGTTFSEGDTITLGVQAGTTNPGWGEIYTDGTNSVVDFQATRAGNTWEWYQDDGSLEQMTLNTTNVLTLYNSSGTAEITLNPTGTSTFAYPVTFGSTAAFSGNTTFSGTNNFTGTLEIGGISFGPSSSVAAAAASAVSGTGSLVSTSNAVLTSPTISNLTTDGIVYTSGGNGTLNAGWALQPDNNTTGITFTAGTQTGTNSPAAITIKGGKITATNSTVAAAGGVTLMGGVNDSTNSTSYGGPVTILGGVNNSTNSLDGMVSIGTYQTSAILIGTNGITTTIGGTTAMSTATANSISVTGAVSAASLTTSSNATVGGTISCNPGGDLSMGSFTAGTPP